MSENPPDDLENRIEHLQRALAAEVRSLLDKCARQEAALRKGKDYLEAIDTGAVNSMHGHSYEDAFRATLDAALPDGSNDSEGEG